MAKARVCTQAASVIFKLVIIFVAFSTGFSTNSVNSLSFLGHMSEPVESFYQEKAKTNCNCSLFAPNTGKYSFQTDSIAVSFVVTVKIESITNSSTSKKFNFVWVQNVRAKFLLALPDDSEILSLSTLQHSVDAESIDMTCPVNESECFNSLSTQCQAEVIVAAFYNNDYYQVSAGQPFCFPPLESKNQSKNNNIVHKCCSWNEDTGYINCTEKIGENVWVAYGIVAVQIGSAFMFILSPLLFKFLPTRDTRVARKSRGTTARRIVSSSIPPMSIESTAPNRKLLTLTEPLSFVTCGGDEAQPCYSRFCRIVAILIFPIVFCTYVIVFFVNNHSTKIRSNVSYYTGLVGFLNPPVEYYLFSIVVFCIVLLGILVLIPGRLSGIGKALSGRRDEKTFLGFEKPEHLVNTHSGRVGFQFLHANMVFHLKCLFDLSFWLFMLKVFFSPCERLIKSCFRQRPESPVHEPELLPDAVDRVPTFCVILGVIFLPVTMLLRVTFVVLALLVYVTPVGYVAIRICHLLFKKDVPFKSECCERLPLCIRMMLVVVLYWFFILFCISVLASYIFVTLMFGVFFYILGKIFLYTLIGIGFNVDFYLPYAVAGIFVLVYVWRAFNHYVSVYENLRIVLFEECEKYEQQASLNGQATPTDTGTSTSPPQSSGTGLLLFLDYNNNPSIPVNLYVATYRRLRPRAKTFFTILTKLFLTFVYLSIAFASIMSLSKTGEASTVYVQASFIFATFALPLALQCGGSSISRKRRKELEYKVRFIIHRYVSKVAVSNESPSGNTTGDMGTTNDVMFEI